MTDKVQKIREEVEIVVNRRLNLLNGDYFDLNEETDGLTNEIMDIIDTLQEEPISEDLEEVAEHLSKIYAGEGSADPKREGCAFYIGFKNGAKWQEKKDQKQLHDESKEVKKS